ncbi:PQQ-binding-like beta-propeller repeat protein [Halomicroarcula sp. GCM10025709]|uniref:outer membrane protein assembly factor BamB family protein n=1 Tax=Halomicroarcula sp. GCM10025709 TaxID=3252669 RepID=UPI00360879EC
MFVSSDRTLAVHDRETGDRRHEFGPFSELNNTSSRTVAVGDGTVFVTSASSTVAIDRGTGTKRWRRDISASYPSGVGICVGSETVVFPVSDPEYALGKETISAFVRESGELRWHYSFELGFDHHVTLPPVLVNEAVFFTATHIDDLRILGDLPE